MDGEDWEKREKKTWKLFHQQLTIAIGTVGAIAFAGLVFIVQNRKPFTYSTFFCWQPYVCLTPDQSVDILILVLAMTSILALVSTLLTSMAGSGFAPEHGWISFLGFLFGIVSLAGFIWADFMAVTAVIPVGAGIFEVALLVVFIATALAFWKDS